MSGEKSSLIVGLCRLWICADSLVIGRFCSATKRERFLKGGGIKPERNFKGKKTACISNIGSVDSKISVGQNKNKCRSK